MKVNGYFYDRIIENKNSVPCRSFLTITKDKIESLKSFDALFIMMNPGGSKPKDESLIKTIKYDLPLKYTLKDLVIMLPIN
jgi:hypothetical protein